MRASASLILYLKIRGASPFPIKWGTHRAASS